MFISERYLFGKMRITDINQCKIKYHFNKVKEKNCIIFAYKKELLKMKSNDWCKKYSKLNNMQECLDIDKRGIQELEQKIKNLERNNR